MLPVSRVVRVIIGFLPAQSRPPPGPHFMNQASQGTTAVNIIRKMMTAMIKKLSNTLGYAAKIGVTQGKDHWHKQTLPGCLKTNTTYTSAKAQFLDSTGDFIKHLFRFLVNTPGM